VWLFGRNWIKNRRRHILHHREDRRDMKKAVPAIICFLLIFVPMTSAGAGGLRLENDRFVIHYTAGDDGLAAELISDSLPIRERVIADIGVDFAEKTEIRLSPTIEAFREAQPGGMWIPLWAAGVAYPELITALIEDALRRGTGLR
jgi:hypothetical protein